MPFRIVLAIVLLYSLLYLNLSTLSVGGYELDFFNFF